MLKPLRSIEATAGTVLSPGSAFGDGGGAHEHVDRPGLAGRELLLQAVEAVDGFRRVAELLAEVERAAVGQVAERAGDQHGEHGDGQRRRAGALTNAADARPQRRRLALLRGGPERGEHRGQQRHAREHGDGHADRQHRAHPAGRVVVGDRQHEHHRDHDPARRDDRGRRARSAIAIASGLPSSSR